MNLTKVHLFVILLLALVLCSFLGGSCGDDAGLEGFNNNNNSSNSSSYGYGKPASPEDGDNDDQKFAPFSSGASGASGSTSASASASGSGIPASQIIPGQDDMYILKSSIVPPVCPVCPAVRCNNNKNSTPAKCPPCPPCARCPEPSFECKKVPNYSMTDNNALPRPVMSSFSQFGL